MTERAGGLAELPSYRFPADGRADPGVLHRTITPFRPRQSIAARGLLRLFSPMKGRHDGEAGNA